MGAGKSTIGPILANTLGWDYFDLDKVIEERTGKKIKQIFEENGEKFFRDTEKNVLTELSKGENLIISLGGGTIANPSNLKILKFSGEIVYLKVSPEEIFKRVAYKKDRPLLNTGEQKASRELLMEKIYRLYNERIRFYEQADIIVDTDNSSVGQTVDEISRLIAKLKKPDYPF
jgi:shikimate kinase